MTSPRYLAFGLATLLAVAGTSSATGTAVPYCPEGETLFEESTPGLRASRLSKKIKRKDGLKSEGECAGLCAAEEQCVFYTMKTREVAGASSGLCMLFPETEREMTKKAKASIGATSTGNADLYVTAFKKSGGCSSALCVGGAKFGPTKAMSIHANFKEKLGRKKVANVAACMKICAADTSCAVITYADADDAVNKLNLVHKVCMTWGEGQKVKPITDAADQGDWKSVAKLAPSCDAAVAQPELSCALGAAASPPPCTWETGKCCGAGSCWDAYEEYKGRNSKKLRRYNMGDGDLSKCLGLCADDAACNTVSFKLNPWAFTDDKAWQCLTFAEATTKGLVPDDDYYGTAYINRGEDCGPELHSIKSSIGTSEAIDWAAFHANGGVHANAARERRERGPRGATSAHL